MHWQKKRWHLSEKYPQICSKQKRYRGCRSYDDRLTFCRNSILVCKAWKCACNEPSGQRIFDVPHGVANAVLLPVIAEYNALADHGKYQTIYNDISQIPAYADEFEPMMLVDAIRELCTDIGIPENLTIAINNASKTGTVTKEEIESRIEPMAVDAMKSGNIAVNPRASRQCDIEMLYRRAL